MEFRITMEKDGEPGGLASLFRWLSQDPEVRATARMSLAPAPVRAGEMGSAFEIINAVVTNTLALSGVAVAVATWRESRGEPRPTVRIEHAGVVVEIHDDSPETIARITRALSGPPAPDSDTDRDTDREDGENSRPAQP